MKRENGKNKRVNLIEFIRKYLLIKLPRAFVDNLYSLII